MSALALVPVSSMVEAEPVARPLTVEGLLFLCVSVGGILVLLVWSYRRLLRSHRDGPSVEP